MKLTANLDKKDELPPAEVVVGDLPLVKDEKPPVGFENAPVVTQAAPPVRVKSSGCCSQKKACLSVLAVVLLLALIAVPVTVWKVRHHHHRRHHNHHGEEDRDDDRRPPHYESHEEMGGSRLHHGEVEVSNKSATPYRIPGAIDMRKGMAVMRDDRIKRCYFLKMPFSLWEDSREDHYGRHMEKLVKMTYIYKDADISGRELVLRTCSRAYSPERVRHELGSNIAEFCGRHRVYSLNLYRGGFLDAMRKTVILRRDFN